MRRKRRIKIRHNRIQKRFKLMFNFAGEIIADSLPKLLEHLIAFNKKGKKKKIKMT